MHVFFTIYIDRTFLKIKFCFLLKIKIIEKLVEGFKLNNRKERENLFTVGLLSAIKYEDVRIVLCKEILAYKKITKRIENVLKNTTIDNNMLALDDLDKKALNDIKNNFKFKRDKIFSKDCPSESKDSKKKDEPFNDNPPLDPNDYFNKKKAETDKDKDKNKNKDTNKDSLPKDTNNPLGYKDDNTDELWAKIRPIIDSLRSLRSNSNKIISLKQFDISFN